MIVRPQGLIGTSTSPLVPRLRWRRARPQKDEGDAAESTKEEQTVG